MLKLPSWISQGMRRLAGAMSGRVTLAVGMLAVMLTGEAAAQTIRLTSETYSVRESDGFIRLAVRRFGDLNKTSTVQISATDGTARDGQEYVARTATLTFPTNSMEQFFDVVILDNAVTNIATTINVALANVSNASLGFPDSATITITDDESGVVGVSTGVLQFSHSAYTVTDYEGTVRNANAGSYPGAMVTVTRSGGNRGRIRFRLTTVEGPGPLNNFVAAAREFVNYVPMDREFVLDDYQMSTNILIDILQYENFERDLFNDLFCWQTNGNGGFTNICGTGTNFPWVTTITNIESGFCIPFEFFADPTNFVVSIAPTFDLGLTLSDPRLDPGEDQTLPQPTLGAVNNARLGITFVDAVKDDDNNTLYTGMGMSFERGHYRAAEGTIGNGRIANSIYQIFLIRDCTHEEPLIHYWVNNGNGGPGPGDHQARTYRPEPEADYATPFVDYLPPATIEWCIALGIEPSTEPATVRWARDQLEPKPLSIPIIADDRVEFDEVLLVQLYQLVGEPEGNKLAAPAPAPYGQVPIQAWVTIEFDRFRFINDDEIFHYSYDTNGVFGAEQPAGAVDRRYNIDGAFDTDPPANFTPGANASVHAMDVGPDGKLVIGGEFTAVNTKPLNRVARMTRDGQVDLTFNVGSGANGAVTAVKLQPDGKTIIGGLFSSYQGQLRNGMARLNVDGSFDNSFNPGLGANGPIRAMELLEDGKILIGGEFTSFNGTNVAYLARLNQNGSLDTSFNANGVGPNGFVYSIALRSEPTVIELHSLDVGQRQERSDVYETGSNEGTIVLDWEFANSPDNIRVYYGTQLLRDTQRVPGGGSASIPYGPGPIDQTQIRVVVNEGFPGVQQTVASWRYKLTIFPRLDSRPVIGGAFSSYNGVQRNRIARILPEGALDTEFDPGTGVESGVVYAVAKQANKVIFGGVFSSINRLSRNNIARLNPSGGVDSNFDPGSGFNDIVYSLVMQPTGKVIAGGIFTEFNGSRRLSLARIDHDGKLDTSFMDTAYNQFAGLPNQYTWQAENSIFALANLRITNTYTATWPITNEVDQVVTNISRTFTRIEDQVFIGGSFERVGGGWLRTDILPRKNFARIWGNATRGPGSVGFQNENYSVDEDSGAVFITVARDRGDLSPVTGAFFTSDLQQGPGVATESVDYRFSRATTAWPSARTVDNWSRKVSDAYRGPNNNLFFVPEEHPNGGGSPGTNSVAPAIQRSIFVSVTDDSVADGDEQLQLNMTVEPTFMALGGVPIPTWPALARSTARLTIVDDDFDPGVIGFASMQFYVDEIGDVDKIRHMARVYLTRTNGVNGQVTVDYRTLTGGTATSGVDYEAVNRGTVVFAAGQTSAFFDIRLIDDTTAEFDETVRLDLFNASGGAKLGLASATLNIVDDDFAAGRMQFSSPTNSVGEGAGVVTITLKRGGGSRGVEEVEVSTFDREARSGLDYTGISNFVVRWTDKDTADKTVNIPILDRNLVDGSRTFRVVLSNARVAGQLDPNALGNQREQIVTIIDNDAFGNMRFSQPEYAVDENGTNAIITVIRVNGVSGDVNVGYEAVAELAVPGEDFRPTSGFFSFTNNQTSASFVVPIVDDSVVDGSKTIILRLTGQTNNPAGAVEIGAMTTPFESKLTIIDNELENIPAGSLDATFVAEGADDFVYTVVQQPDSRLLIGGDFRSVNSVLRNRLARLETDGSVDSTFFPGAGPNGSVRAMAVQPDSRILIAGAFTSVAGTNRNYIARLVRDGLVDQTFDPGAGANNPVYAMVLQPDGKIVIGGDFSAYGPTARNGVARLNTNGVLDATFNPGTGASGPSTFTVYAIAQQLDGKLIVGGDFDSFNNIPAKRIVRLNRDGSVDATFNTSVGANGSVRALLVQPDGRILVGGLFTSLQGSAANRMARLNTDGSLDSSFNPAPEVEPARRGPNGPVTALAIQIDGKVMVGGDFTEYNGVTRRGLTRLESNGRNDATINFGTGVNGSISSLLVQADRKVVLAGGFTEYNGQPRQRLARINGGSIAGNGRFEFARASYVVSEAGTNALITVRRTGGTSGTIRMNVATRADSTVPQDSAAIPGVDYTTTTATLTFPEGETQASFRVPVQDDTTVENEKIFEVALSDLVGEPFRLGDQPTARVVITSDDSEIYFVAPAFSVGESIPSAAASVTIERTGAVSVPVTVNFRTADGTATSGVDYAGATNTITFGVGESQRTLAIGVSSDLLVEGNETVNLILSNPGRGGVLRAGGDTARLTIVDDDFAAGEIRFQRATYSVREGNTVAQVAVIRTNGVTGVVTVQYDTSAVAGGPVSGQDYSDVQGILTFNDGESLKFIEVPINDDDFVENNESVNVRLFNVGGDGPTLGLANAILTIIDDDLGSGSLDDSFNPGTAANGTVRSIKLDAAKRFVIGGDFTAFNNNTFRSRIARLLVDGGLDGSFSTNNRANNGIATVALQEGDGKIVVGGAFDNVQGQIERRVARLMSDGSLDTSFNLPLGLDGEVSSVAIQPDGKVLIGGKFTAASAASRNRISRLTSAGRVDITFDPGEGADNNVNVVKLQGDKVLIGGAFGTVNGVGAGRIARLNANGSIDTSFRTGTGFSRADGVAMVYDIVLLANGHIMVAGDFTSYNGSPRAGIAVLDQNGALQSFGSGLSIVNGAIRAIALQITDRNRDDKVIIGGDFTAVDGTTRMRVARLDAAGNFDPSFDPGDGANATVLGVIVQPWDGRVVVIGAFTEFNNNENFHGIARMNNDKAFQPPVTTEIRFGAATLSAGGIRIAFEGELGVSYVIEGSTDLVTWSDVRSVVGNGPDTNAEIPTTGEHRFLRIRRQ